MIRYVHESGTQQGSECKCVDIIIVLLFHCILSNEGIGSEEDKKVFVIFWKW